MRVLKLLLVSSSLLCIDCKRFQAEVDDVDLLTDMEYADDQHASTQVETAIPSHRQEAMKKAEAKPVKQHATSDDLNPDTKLSSSSLQVDGSLDTTATEMMSGYPSKMCAYLNRLPSTIDSSYLNRLGTLKQHGENSGWSVAVECTTSYSGSIPGFRGEAQYDYTVRVYHEDHANEPVVFKSGPRRPELFYTDTVYGLVPKLWSGGYRMPLGEPSAVSWLSPGTNNGRRNLVVEVSYAEFRGGMYLTISDSPGKEDYLEIPANDGVFPDTFYFR